MRYFRITFSLALWVVLVTTVFSECPIPKKPPYKGRTVFEAPHHSNWTMAPENYVLRFRCYRGYVLKGAKVTMCSSDQWTDEVPTCLKMQCGDPPDTENGRYTLQTGVHDAPTIGSTAHYSCNDGFKLENETDPFLVCHLFKDSSRAEWRGERPKCLKLDSCPDPGKSADGTREGKCCLVGDKLSFSCNEDFDQEGPEEIECLPGGIWSSPRPRCRPPDDHCDLPPPIPHGVVKGEKKGDFYRPYDDLEILCEPGFKYTGSEYVMCEEESGWEEEFGECVEAFCDRPPPLAHGSIVELETTNQTSFPYDFELTYVCDDGFRLIGGDSWRSCDSRGWTGKNPHCEKIECPDPGVPEYGSRIGSNFSIGEKVTYKCFTGFTLLGSFERYCMPNGQWEGEVARCDHTSNYCPNPGIPVNGAKNSSNYDMGEYISFRCHEGYSIVGSEIRECLPNRTWTGTQLKCIGPNDYDNPAQVRDILKSAVAQQREEQQLKLEVYQKASAMSWSDGPVAPRIIDLNFPGRLIFYFAFDTSGSVKKSHFKESVALAKAIVKKVGISEHGARAGALTFSSKATIEFLPVDYTSTEKVLEALDRLNYTGGGTSATSALALLREEIIPVTEGVFLKKEQKSIIFILTDGKANMGGDPKGEADLLKADGAEIYCVGITNSAMLDSLYKIASDPLDEHVFVLKNYPTLAYLIQELTEGEIDYSQCGLGLDKLGRQTSRGRIIGGNNAVEPWPWMAAIYIKKRDKGPELSCGGSIIKERFILTAAHCLYIPKTDIRREVSSIIIKLGITNVKNETNLQEFEAEEFFIHPLYVNDDVYDFDIAIIKLKRPIEFNDLVRPICLPPIELPPETNLYKAGELAVATGWGHTGVVKKRERKVDWLSQEDLKQIVLPIQPTERCIQSIIDNGEQAFHFTERMFCVGDGEGGNDTCRGDSGGPLMQSQLNKEGYTFWTQIGIVSWGIGCGLPNTYGFYSHVYLLMDWLQNTLNDESFKPENEI